MSTPVRPNDPQSPPRDIPAMPDPNRERPEPEEGQELHWPDIPINEVPDDEREALMQQAGPVGEQARLAWNAYQENQQTGDEDPASVARERQRLAELGQAPPEDAQAVRAQAAQGPRVETPTTQAAQASTQGRPPGQSGAVAAGTAEGAGMAEEDEAAETGAKAERADAEKKAKKLGLEVRDFGTSGDWRLYDPETGRQVSKARLDE